MSERITGFKGLDLADAQFSSTDSSCSAAGVEKRCGNRDCKLHVYNLGGENILAGGLCDKGNTNASLKKAPDYVRRYNKLFDEHLRRVSSPLEELSTNPDTLPTIFMPRALSFLNDGRGILYAGTYNALGFNVVVSPESDEGIAKRGRQIAHSAFCFPVILAHGHASLLRENMRPYQDKIFLVDAMGSGEDNLRFCPLVGSNGRVIKGNLGIPNEEALLPVLFFDNPRKPVADAVYDDLVRVFGKGLRSRRDVQRAVAEAEEKKREFLDEAYAEGDRTVKKIRELGEPVYVAIGRPYTVNDPVASSGMSELFASQGLHLVPGSFLRPSEHDVSQFVDNMYWTQGIRIVKLNAAVAETTGMFAIRETNFACGPDTLLDRHEKDMQREAGKPHGIFETDGHASKTGFTTRVIAHDRVVREHKEERKIKLSPRRVVPVSLDGRVLAVPCMGNSAHVLTAAFQAMGYDAEVMATRTPLAMEMARKLVHTNTCLPYHFVIGDGIAHLMEMRARGVDPNKKAAVFLPKASGPCRFGQYSVVMRKVLDDNGFQDVPIVSPGSSTDYKLEPGMANSRTKTLKPLALKGILAHDILENAVMRVRPYEKNSGDAERTFREAYDELQEIVRQNPTISRLRTFMTRQNLAFGKVMKEAERKPIVLMNGEIFVRCHEKANDDLAKQLESRGVEVMIEPTYSWIDYVNRTVMREARRMGDYGQLAHSLVSRVYMDFAHHSLFAPFRKLLAGREFHNPYHFIDAAHRELIIDSVAVGEAPISVGQVRAFLKGEMPSISGIAHVSPLECMQETLAESMIEASARDYRAEARPGEYRVVPIIHAVYGPSRQPNFDAMEDVFVQKVYIYRDLQRNAG